MQKKLIALAVAGLVSGGAFAQSSVTIYGVADASFDVVKVSGSTATPSADIGNYTRVSTNSSVLGFKGSEALGNGLTAVFQFESSVGFDVGGALGTTRDSFVGLEGAYGSMKLGNLTTPTRALGTALDVNAGATGIGGNSGILGKLSGATLGGGATGLTNAAGIATAAACAASGTCQSIFDLRHNNTALYTSPTFSGFSGSIAYIAGENKGTNGANSKPNSSAFDLGLNYKNGPITAGFTHANVKAKDAAENKASESRLAGIYNFGQGDVRLLWAQTKAEDNSGTWNAKQTVWGLGGTFNATANGKVIAQYYKAKSLTGTNGATSAASAIANANTGAKLLEIGYEHSLSKRTMLKAIYAKLSNEQQAQYDFGTNATGGITAGGLDPSGLQIGIRHSF